MDGFSFFLFVIVNLIAGSLLNRLIDAIPQKLLTEWENECVDFLTLDKTKKEIISVHKIFWLHCDACKSPLNLLQQLPLIGTLFGKHVCKNCHKVLPWRLPLIEIFFVLISILLFWFVSDPWHLTLVILFTWTLLLCLFIDMKYQVIPDLITLPLLWFGLLLNITGTFTTINNALIGAIAGYLVLFIPSFLFSKFTQRDSMGLGDAKLLAAFGAWFGFPLLPVTLVMAFLLFLITAIPLRLWFKTNKTTLLAFGPYLACAMGLAILFGKKITLTYLYFSGFIS